MRCAANVLPVVFAAVALSCGGGDQANNKFDPVAGRQLDSLLEEREYFQLRNLLRRYENRISETQREYYSAFVASAFNDYERSISMIADLLKDRTSSITDSTRMKLLLLQRDNYFRTFQYSNAATTGKELIDKYEGLLGERISDIRNTNIIDRALVDTPAQQVHLQADSLTWTKNKVGHIEIPVKAGGATVSMIFDTRAFISTVTETTARKLQLKMLPVTYRESSGITGKSFDSRLGIARDLYIGNIHIEHVVFQVLPDEILAFPSIDFQIHGLIGFPVITALQRIRIHQDGKFVIAPKENFKQFRNMAFDATTTVINCVVDNDTLSYHFDTGATGTEFYSRYFDRSRAAVLKTGARETVQSGGAGGTIDREVYILPRVSLTIGDKVAVLDNLSVHTTPPFAGLKYYGNIGQDVIQQFGEMELDFESMSLGFKSGISSISDQ